MGIVLCIICYNGKFYGIIVRIVFNGWYLIIVCWFFISVGFVFSIVGLCFVY